MLFWQSLLKKLRSQYQSCNARKLTSLLTFRQQLCAPVEQRVFEARLDHQDLQVDRLRLAVAEILISESRRFVANLRHSP